MSPGSIFISYRRDDSAGYARAIGDRLGRRYGADKVFVDVDDIDPGHRFDGVIAAALKQAEIVLVLIGKRWRGERSEGRTARIDEPDDRVRHEVASALASSARVVPVLLDGAPMPDAASLPAPLQALAAWQAVELDNNRFEADLQRLLDAIDAAIGSPRAGQRAIDRRRVFGALGGVALAAAGGALWWSTQRAPAPAAARPASPAFVRPAVNGRWRAEVEYDWPNARYSEPFEFGGEGASLHGSAGFLGLPRGIEEGRVEAGGLSFVTRSAEAAGEARRETVHRYTGQRVGADEMRFTMQTEGASTPHVPVQFVARRVGG